MAADCLFVYGTLRRGSNNRFARLLAEKAEYLSAAQVRGCLYDFGRYPGARPGDGLIIGEIFQLREPAMTLAVLDDYEGPEFDRAVVPAHLDDARTIDCWIYWYTGTAPGNLIASGLWSR